MEPGNIFTVLFGLCFVAAGIYIHAHMGRFIETAQAASGVVVEVAHQSEGTKKGRMHPIVRFTTVDGKEVVGKSEQHHNVKPGQSLQVLYDPKNPERIEIGTLSQARRQRLFFTGLCVVFGLAVCVIGVALDLGLVKRQ